MRVVFMVSKVKVIRLAVADGQEKGNGVNYRFGRRIIAEVLGLIAPEKPSCLQFRCMSTREFLIKIDDPLHPHCVRSGAQCLG
jgi:hypothetical protein